MQAQNLEGFSDKTLAVMKFEDMQGKLIAAVLNYACHGTHAFCVKDTDGKVKVTPEFTGFACSYIEQRNNDEAVVLWTSGAAGDQNPLFSSEGFPRTYELDGYSESVETPPGTQYIIQRHHGYVHALDAIKVLDAITDMKDRMKIKTAMAKVELDGQTFPPGEDKMLNRLMVDNFVRKYYPELCVDGKPPEKKLVQMIAEGTVQLQMQLAILGDVAWVGAAAELYNEIGYKLKLHSPLKNTVVVTHTESEGAGYILSDASAHHDVFQSFSRVRPGNNDTPVIGGMLQLFDEALNQ